MKVRDPFLFRVRKLFKYYIKPDQICEEGDENGQPGQEEGVRYYKVQEQELPCRHHSKGEEGAQVQPVTCHWCYSAGPGVSHPDQGGPDHLRSCQLHNYRSYQVHCLRSRHHHQVHCRHCQKGGTVSSHSTRHWCCSGPVEEVGRDLNEFREYFEVRFKWGDGWVELTDVDGKV